MRLFNIGMPGLFLGVSVPVNDGLITVISGGAIEPGIKAAVSAFEKQTGHKVDITFNTAPRIRERINAGETFDVVVAPSKVIEEFSKTGKVEKEGLLVGRVGSGAAVRPGTPVPKIANTEDLCEVVLNADSIVFNRASTGIYFENLLKKLGVWDRVEPKTTRYATGAEVMKHVMKGTGKEVAFGPITEIHLEAKHGLVYVGPLPPDAQNYTSYTAVPMTSTAQLREAQALVTFLGSPEGREYFVAAGIE